MKTTYQQISRSVVFLICCLAASWAQAATVFNVNFFDENNAEVGQGQLAVAFGGSACLPILPGDCDFYPGLTVRNPLAGFSANILGEAWGQDKTMWWTAEGQSTGTLIFHRSPEPFIIDGWFFGDQFFSRRTLSMGLSTGSNALSASGSWFQQFMVDDPNVPSGFIGTGGTWTATATPIPTAVWLFASGLGALGVLRRKKA